MYLQFSRDHLSYVNQIFGDQTVRQIISEIWPSPYKFHVQEAGADFLFSNHHVLKLGGKLICSLKEGYQDIKTDLNDNLCQSYTLLTFFNISFSKSMTFKAKKSRQLKMVAMYKQILSNRKFKTKFKEILIPENLGLWTDYSTNKPLKVSFKKIHSVLNAWKKYGFHYFIGNSPLC
jgi:hypothetical protein